MSGIRRIRNLKCLEAIRWDSNLIILTVVYSNQDIHLQSIKNLAHITANYLRVSIIIVDNKGDYDLSRLHAVINQEGQCEIDVYYHKRIKRSRLEKDGAYNHSSAINEVFRILQTRPLITTLNNSNPITMLMDPDLFLIDNNYYNYFRKKLETHDLLGTRWTIVKTHKFHNFPTPHLFVTDLKTLRKMVRIDYRSKPIMRNITRFLFKFKPVHFLSLYNSYDPGSRMNSKKSLPKAKILFFDQYYWKEEIRKLEHRCQKKGICSRQNMYSNRIPTELVEESSFWINHSVKRAVYLLANFLKGNNTLVRLSDVYTRLLLDKVEIKYFDDLKEEQIPEFHTSADIFYSEESEIFAIHGHMNSKARSKEKFLAYLEGFNNNE